MRIKKGFTLIELTVVVAIMVILATLVVVNVTKAKSKAKLSRVSAELNDISIALNQYAQDHSFQYPADTTRAVPPGLEKYLSGGTWPTSVWPHGVYDWDNWVDANNNQIYQITYRLCDVDDPISYCSDPVLFPNFVRNSGIYYCVQGPCVPHRDTPTVPGYCVNCTKKEVNY